MTDLDVTTTISGTCDAKFHRVRDVFASTFTAAEPYRNVGASLAVYLEGRCVIDLSGGSTSGKAWTGDTLVNIWSATKGIAAIAVAMLVDEGKLSYDDKVSAHWPEFAQAGKQDVTVAHIMSHQSGLNGFVEPTAIEDFYDWSRVTTRLAAQAPFWKAGENTSYHAMTYGFLAGELVHRVSGLDIVRFVQERIAAPVKADVFIGAPRALRSRVAPIIGPKASRALSDGMDPIAQKAVVNPGLSPELPNESGWMDAKIPAGNGHASATGLARVYGAVANDGTLDGAKLLSRATIDLMRRPLSTRADLMLGPRTWAAGVVLNTQGGYGPEPSAFGHSGWGGSFGCADVHRRLGIGYVHNQMGPNITGDPRGSSICTAIYDSL
jgi:CubicO group peptidase (beta-lactamase class C family)